MKFISLPGFQQLRFLGLWITRARSSKPVFSWRWTVWLCLSGTRPGQRGVRWRLVPRKV